MPTPQFFHGLFKQLSSKACLIDVTPPTFGGITTAIAKTSGAFEVDWSPATEVISPPVEYKIYVGLGVLTAAELFALNPVMHTQTPTKALIFTLNDHETYFVKGQTYTIGVRAEDGVGNTDSNNAIVVVAAIATGNLPDVLQATADDLDADLATLTNLIGTLQTSVTDAIVGEVVDDGIITGQL